MNTRPVRGLSCHDGNTPVRVAAAGHQIFYKEHENGEVETSYD